MTILIVQDDEDLLELACMQSGPDLVIDRIPLFLGEIGHETLASIDETEGHRALIGVGGGDDGQAGSRLVRQ
jgi:hypothetical protein